MNTFLSEAIKHYFDNIILKKVFTDNRLEINLKCYKKHFVKEYSEPTMPLKLIKIMLAGVLAGHLLKANRIRSTARFSRAGWAMFFTTAKFFWLVFKYARQREKELKMKP